MDRKVAILRKPYETFKPRPHQRQCRQKRRDIVAKSRDIVAETDIEATRVVNIEVLPVLQ